MTPCYQLDDSLLPDLVTSWMTNGMETREDCKSKNFFLNSISFPRLVVFCLLLLLSCFFGCLFLFYFIVETRRKKINKREIRLMKWKEESFEDQ